MLPRLHRQVQFSILIIIGLFISLRNVYNRSLLLNHQEKTRTLKITVIGSDDGSRKAEGTRTKSRDTVEECNIPQLDINGSEVFHFFKDTPFHCGNAANKMSDLDGNGRFRILKEGATCKVRTIMRGKDDFEHSLGEWKSISNGDALPSEGVDVECTKSRNTWRTFLIAPQISDEIVAAAKKRRQKSVKKGLGLNVLMMSFDSMSQMTFRRKLPKSVEVLEKTLGAIVLKGYNIVGDGTPQAFIPILTGKTEEELPLTRKRFKEAQTLDKVYPMVWNNFSEAGYLTLFAEDDAASGMFNYRLKGFAKQPTDLYMRPVTQAMEKRNSRNFVRCIGEDVQHTHWLRYARLFLSSHSDALKFGLMHHGVYSHDDINMIGNMDGDFSGWLSGIHSDGLLNNTILIVMADHGHRFAQLRSTHQGQLEERLPFFSITLPESFKATHRGKKIEKNLRDNSNRLLTPFDVHRTLLDVVEMEEGEQEVMQSVNHRSLSMFRSVPSTRSCSQAGVEPHWCTCLNWVDALGSEGDKKVSHNIALAIVDTLRAETNAERENCAELQLKEIHYVKKLVPNEGVLKYKNVKDQDGFVPKFDTKERAESFAHYQLKLSTTPGRGVYEVTAAYWAKEQRMELDLASVSHVSQYGDDPHCVIDRNYFLAKYCVCRDRI